MKFVLNLLTLLVFAFSVNAQFNSEAPWMKALNEKLKTTNESLKFQEIVDAFNVYWETRDPNIKASGYKPFKRWENYWQYFVKPDGTLPSSKELYNTNRNINKSNTQNLSIDESNWLPVGPFTYTNTGSWSSGHGRLNVIIKDQYNPNIYYAGAPAGGFWKSTDGGVSWTTSTDNLQQIGVSGIAAISNTIYIATGDDDAGNTYSIGVLKSTDGGQTFSPTGLNPNNFPDVNSMNDIYINPNNSNMLWVATNKGVFKTTDAGINWYQSIGTIGVNIRDLKVKPNNPSIIYAVSSNRFYKSTDSGDNFNIVTSGLPLSSGVSRYVIDVTEANSDVVYLLASDNDNAFKGVYKSSNSGGLFSTVADLSNNGDIFESTQSWYDLALAVSDTDENQIFVGVLNIWRGTIGVAAANSSFTKLNNWNIPNSASYTHADIHYLRFFNGELLAGTDGGFYKSTNNGDAFVDLTEGMQIGQFYKISVAKNSSNKVLGGLQDNGGYGLNNNQWQNFYGADGMDTAIDPNNSNLYYGFVQNGLRLHISESSGGSNDGSIDGPTGENGNWVTPLAINKESEIFAGYSRLYKVNGNLFVPISPVQNSNIDKLEIDEINPNNIYIAVNNVLRKSTDRGVSFTSQHIFPFNITSIEVNHSDNNIIYVTTSFNVYQSNDGGNNFFNISNGLPNVPKTVIKHQSLHPKNPIYVGTSLGVYRYDDDTLQWNPFEIGLPNVLITDLEINVKDNKITAGTYGRGVWQSEIPVELAVDDVELLNVINVSSEVNCNGFIEPLVEVKNNGQNLITEITISYSINGASSVYDWTGNLPSSDTTVITLPNINLAKGVYDLKVNTTIFNDAYVVNNTSPNIMIYANDSGMPNYINTLENNTDELLSFNNNSSTTLWKRGIPTGTFLNNGNTTSNNVFGTNLSGNYSNNTKSYLFSQCYDLTSIDNPELKFNMGFDLEENWDVVYIEYSIDNGVTWNVLGDSTDINWYNSSTEQGQNNTCFNCLGNQWTGTETTMKEYKKDLSAFTNVSSFMFRYVFHSDELISREGVIVDDIVITGNVLGTKEFSKPEINIYPNPSQGVFSLKSSNNMSFNYTVYDLTGKRIFQNTNVSTVNNLYQFNLKNYSKGIYFLNIVSNDVNLIKKIILN